MSAASPSASGASSPDAMQAVQRMSIKQLRALLDDRGVGHAHLRVKGDLRLLVEDILAGRDAAPPPASPRRGGRSVPTSPRRGAVRSKTPPARPSRNATAAASLDDETASSEAIAPVTSEAARLTAVERAASRAKARQRSRTPQRAAPQSPPPEHRRAAPARAAAQPRKRGGAAAVPSFSTIGSIGLVVVAVLAALMVHVDGGGCDDDSAIQVAGACQLCPADSTPRHYWFHDGECLCKPGYYQSDGAGRPCVSCTPGKYKKRVGNSRCKVCKEGRAPDRKSAATRCAKCERGKSSPKGASTCKKCDPGKYAAYQGLATCDQCERGKYRKQGGGLACKKCEAGAYARGFGSRECKACAAGQYVSEKGAVQCIECPESKYSTATGDKVECQSCGWFKTCPAGSTDTAACALSALKWLDFDADWAKDWAKAWEDFKDDLSGFEAWKTDGARQQSADQGDAGQQGCPFKDKNEFAKTIRNTEEYRAFRNAPLGSKEARTKGRWVLLHYHPDKFKLVFPSCPTAMANAFTQEFTQEFTKRARKRKNGD